MTVLRFIFGLTVVTVTVAAWSAWSGVDGWTFAMRIVVSLVLVQLGYVAHVLWSAYRAPAGAEKRKRGPVSGRRDDTLERERPKPAKRAL